MGTLKTKAQSILTEKNTKIIPGNIKSGVEIFGVTGTHEGGSKLNIYTQLEEPTKKDGLWLKSNVDIDQVETDTNVTLDPYWDTEKMSKLRNIPYSYYDGAAVAIGTNVYIFGSYNNLTNAYRYDTLTDTYTKLTNIPVSFNGGKATVIGTDCYLFTQTTTYKYDTLTDTYTQLANVGYNCIDCSVAAVGTSIYLFGGSKYVSSYKTAYRYDTLTDTYTKLQTMPYNCFGSSAIPIDNYIYIFRCR